jgi:hypothetical protein
MVLAAGGIATAILPSCETTLTTFNPCGSVFAFCEPYEVDRIFAGVPDFYYDPSCTIPFFGLDPANPAGECSTTETFITPGQRPDPLERR